MSDLIRLILKHAPQVTKLHRTLHILNGETEVHILSVLEHRCYRNDEERFTDSRSMRQQPNGEPVINFERLFTTLILLLLVNS